MAEDSWGPTAATLSKLIDACVAEGTMAPGHQGVDVLMLMSLLWRVAANDDDAQGRRIIATVFTGLQAKPQLRCADRPP